MDYFKQRFSEVKEFQPDNQVLELGVEWKFCKGKCGLSTLGQCLILCDGNDHGESR